MASTDVLEVFWKWHMAQGPQIPSFLPLHNVIPAPSKGSPMEAPTLLGDLHWTPLEGPGRTGLWTPRSEGGAPGRDDWKGRLRGSGTSPRPHRPGTFGSPIWLVPRPHRSSPFEVGKRFSPSHRSRRPETRAVPRRGPRRSGEGSSRGAPASS